jgi:hypothetical protein
MGAASVPNLLEIARVSLMLGGDYKILGLERSGSESNEKSWEYDANKSPHLAIL